MMSKSYHPGLRKGVVLVEAANHGLKKSPAGVLKRDPPVTREKSDS